MYMGKPGKHTHASLQKTVRWYCELYNGMQVLLYLIENKILFTHQSHGSPVPVCFLVTSGGL